MCPTWLFLARESIILQSCWTFRDFTVGSFGDYHTKLNQRTYWGCHHTHHQQLQNVRLSFCNQVHVARCGGLYLRVFCYCALLCISSYLHLMSLPASKHLNDASIEGPQLVWGWVIETWLNMLNRLKPYDFPCGHGATNIRLQLSTKYFGVKTFPTGITILACQAIRCFLLINLITRIEVTLTPEVII